MELLFIMAYIHIMDMMILKVQKEAKLESGKICTNCVWKWLFRFFWKGENIAAPNFLVYKRAKLSFGKRMNVVDEGSMSKCCATCDPNNNTTIILMMNKRK